MIEIFDGHMPNFKKEKYIHYSACVIGMVDCKKRVNIWPNAVIRGDVNKIVIGECTNIQDGSVLHVTDVDRLIIGDYVTVGHNCNLHGCTIGDESLIGIGSIVLDGVKIGKHCVIAAGSVVPPNKVIPDGSIFIKGEIKPVKESLIEGLKEHAEMYWELAQKFIRTSEYI